MKSWKKNLKQQPAKITHNVQFTQRTRHTLFQIEIKYTQLRVRWRLTESESGFGAYTRDTRTDRYFVLQWTEMSKQKKKNYCMISLRLCHTVSYSYTHTNSLTHLLQSLAHILTLFAIAHTYTRVARVCVCAGMLLCACVLFGIWFSVYTNEWMTERESKLRNQCIRLCMNVCVCMTQPLMYLIGVHCSMCIWKWNTLTFHCCLYSHVKSLRGHNVYSYKRYFSPSLSLTLRVYVCIHIWIVSFSILFN